VATKFAEGTEAAGKIHKRRNGENGDETEKTCGLAPRVAHPHGADLRSAPEPAASLIRQAPIRAACALPVLGLHDCQNLLRFVSVHSVSPFVNSAPSVCSGVSKKYSRAMRLDSLRRWAVILDSLFQVPGTSIRFGLDAIVGLIPGLGDMASPIYTALILLEGLRRRVPAVVQARMVLNAALDMGIGLVPLLGDVADVAWKANLRNLALLERHARPGTPPSAGDYVFVALCIAAVALIAIVPVALIIWLLSQRPLV
jgi:uncharacterized protein DUF4112